MKIESEIKESPLFSFKNFFRPTDNNVLIWSSSIKAQCVIAMTSAYFLSNIWLFLGGLVVGGICEAFIYFTSKTPVTVIAQAVEDIKEEVKEGDCHE